MAKKIVALRANYDEQNWDPGINCSVDPATGEVLPSLTQQQYKDDCDINKILERYARTGELTHMMKRDPAYGDFSKVPDYLDAMGIVLKAQEQFENLDAPIRKRFNNDPAEFLAFATNAENLPEMVKMGLAVAKPQPTPSKTPDVDPSTASKSKGDPKTPDVSSGGKQSP